MKKTFLLRAGICGLFAAAASIGTLASAAPVQSDALADLSLEQLSELIVTSVSRREERLSEAASSIYVIRREDIRRSGATSLAEALRLAPNLEVARVNASNYAITARGGNSTTANKLLVMVDGRTVYTPLYSGVFWDAQAVMLSDIERIEVISGPGATLWGANAVNGVINVITRTAGDTQGTAAEIIAGSRDSYAAARTGGEFGAAGRYRVYGMASERGPSRSAAGGRLTDRALHGQGGMRADWSAGAGSYTMQADIYRGDIDQVSGAGTADISGANILGRMNRRFADGSSFTLQAYLDHTERDIPQTFAQTLDVLDVEFQHALAPLGEHQVLWGAGYRYGNDRVGNSAALAFLPAERDLHQGHVFVQDQWKLNPKLALTAGIKLERNPYTGVETLPNLRLSYHYSDQSLIWGALSRAVRAPSRLDREFFVPAAPPHVILAGGPNFESEIANVLEVGYRGQPSATLNYSVTLFHHEYDRLRSLEPRPGGPQLENGITGTTTGVEAWGSYQATRAWRLSAGITAMDIERRLRAGSNDTGAGLRSLGNDPDLSVQLRSSYQLSERAEVDLSLRHVGSLPEPRVPSYTVVDARLGWQLAPDLELSLIAENLFDRRHVEWSSGPGSAEFGRNLMVKLVWRN